MNNNQSICVDIANNLAALAQHRAAALLVGICGMQGVGKTTFCRQLAQVLTDNHGLRVAQLSIDDFYLSHEERAVLASRVSPLLQTRGVPGTHNKVLMEEVLSALKTADASSIIRLPRFDKATDNPVPKEQQPLFVGNPDIILFEGWCVGAVPQLSVEVPCNDLECTEDPNGNWRQFVNQQLYEYQPIFEWIDFLIYITAPSFEQAKQWRNQQEQDLKQVNRSNPNAHIMTYEELMRFMAHYERLSKHIAATMPEYADMVLYADENHAYSIHN